MWAVTIVASGGSFAAVSTLLAPPLLGAFLIMEAAERTPRWDFLLW